MPSAAEICALPLFCARIERQQPAAAVLIKCARSEKKFRIFHECVFVSRAFSLISLSAFFYVSWFGLCARKSRLRTCRRALARLLVAASNLFQELSTSGAFNIKRHIDFGKLRHCFIHKCETCGAYRPGNWASWMNVFFFFWSNSCINEKWQRLLLCLLFSNYSWMEMYELSILTQSNWICLPRE